ncbi:MAG TPA: hypothetical protein VK420_10740 [Longimicrobium sp.]|jgi:hypothetical protein|nr:hypothetical protein [Longimicrobium sp.]
MLEQIHATPEDRRATHIALSLGAISFGGLAMADALLAQSPAVAALGTVIATAGAITLGWVRRTPVRTD